LEKYLGDNRMDSPTSRLVIPVTDLNTDKLEIFDSLDSYSPHVQVKDVLLATTAAPTYFKQVMDKAAVQGHEYASGTPYAYADGGLNANRPANEVLMLLKKDHTREEQKEILDSTMVCSLNFNEPDKFIFPTSGLGIYTKAKEVVGRFIKNQEASSTAEVKNDLPEKDEFFEIGLPITKETESLDNANPENIERLEEIGRKYVQENNELIQRLCDSLLDNLNKEKELATNQTVDLIDEGFAEEENIENNKEAVNKPIAQSLDSDDEGFEDDNVGYEKEELLTGIKNFFNKFSESNPELKQDIDVFLNKVENYTLEEIKEGIVSFEQASLKWQNEQNNLDVFSSCSMEALKEEIDLEGIDDEVSNHEIFA